MGFLSGEVFVAIYGMNTYIPPYQKPLHAQRSSLPQRACRYDRPYAAAPRLHDRRGRTALRRGEGVRVCQRLRELLPCRAVREATGGLPRENLRDDRISA